MRLHASRTLRVDPTLPPTLAALRSISSNLFWSWNTDAVAMFRRIDPLLWERSGHNPTRLLQLVPTERLEALAGDAGFVAHVSRVAGLLDAYLSRAAEPLVPDVARPGGIAYFSLEFAITESLPVYSGGLGVLAGDHLKSASDLGLPLVGVSLLYRQGYFQQALQSDGWQQEEYEDMDFDAQPLLQVRDAAGEAVVVAVPFDDREVHVAVWKLTVGCVALYLLDTDLPENRPEDRGISGRLYGGDAEMRIEQEMVLGIGGIRALHAMGIDPTVCHMNEGHSALLAVERIRMLMEESGVTFEEARVPVAASTAFTTHTAVAAGIDLFPAELVRRNLGRYYTAMGVDERTFVGLGRTHPDDPEEPFSMAMLGLKLSGFRNGVSQLHRIVSQQLWESHWPSLPADEIPIGAVTNGVHLPTWVSHEMGELFDRSVGEGWRDRPADLEVWQRIHEVSDDELWRTHEVQRSALVARAREQQRETALRRGGGLARAGALRDGILTVGFARRFAEYKRATLLFRDPERLARIVNNPERPVQFLFAGKAHPRDEAGKRLIRDIVEFSREPRFRDRVIVLERYDVELARTLVQGADVWLNTPLRPLEASGTSGMKAVANGAIHLSVLDGWWAEAYAPGLGWAIGGETAQSNPEVQDAIDADSLYALLEEEVVPAFYTRDAVGLPRNWIGMMKRSIAAFAPRFNTGRMVRDYASKAYAPAAESWARLREGDLAPARELASWSKRIAADWGSVKIFAIDGAVRREVAAGAAVPLVVQIHPGPVRPTELRVDVVHGPAGHNGEIHGSQISSLLLESVADDGLATYSGTFLPAQGGHIGYAIRITPYHPDLPNPLDMGLVHWA